MGTLVPGGFPPSSREQVHGTKFGFVTRQVNVSGKRDHTPVVSGNHPDLVIMRLSIVHKLVKGEKIYWVIVIRSSLKPPLVTMIRMDT